MAEARGFRSAYALWKEVGGSKEMTYGLGRNDCKMISLDTLAKLCRVLSCQPGRLLKYELGSNG